MTLKQTIIALMGASLVAASACKSTGTEGESDDAVVVDGVQEETEARQEVVVSGITAQDIGAVPPPAPPPPPPSAVYARAAPVMTAPMPVFEPPPVDTERYEDVDDNPVKLVAEEPVSTFSIDVDTAGYANVRRFLNDGVLPPIDAVRIEELINYFDYAYATPESGEVPFATEVTVMPSPWAEGRELVHIGIQGYDVAPEVRPPVNLTLLIDVSGSMSSQDKLPLAKKALAMMIDQMEPTDTIAIAVYAGAAGEVLPPTRVADKGKILASFEALSAGGSTAGGEGLRLAYALAEQSYDPEGVNRVMILTDGDFNVGITSDERLEDFVARKRETGIYLSVMGFGTGNYNDQLMQKIAQAGNGVAGYVDTLNEARKLLADDLSSNLFTIADDVKIQIEFNPAVVAEYRLIGYETRMLNREDFNNDEVDAGEIGSGASVTAIYEIARVGSSGRLVDESRYAAAPPAATDTSGEIAFLKIRWKPPGEEESQLITRPITETDTVASVEAASESARWATAVAAYGQLLKTSPYTAAGYGFDDVIALAQGARGDDPFGYRAEFVQLARAAEVAAAQATLETGSGTGD